MQAALGIIGPNGRVGSIARRTPAPCRQHWSIFWATIRRAIACAPLRRPPASVRWTSISPTCSTATPGSSSASPMSPDRKLIVSIHDVGPKFEPQVDALVDRLTQRLGHPRFAMLVVPNHWSEAPLANNSAYQTKLRRWADAGVEMFVHGWFHRDDSRHAGALNRFKSRHMTAGEGEFLGLSEREALRRMREGRRLIEDIIGRPVTGFVAPAWLYGGGARAALAQAGFALAEDHMRVWRPATGEIVARGPVITWASRSAMRIASSLAV